MIKRICSRCVMDNTSDDTIFFEEDGTCNYCNYALSRKDLVYFPNEEGKNKLNLMIKMLKEHGKGKEYDCLMGMSGGLDSSYLAYLGAKKWGLRILAIHVDDGFNTEIAQKNINNLCEKYGIKLIVVKPDRKEYMDLIKSFFKAGVPSITIPQDNIYQSYLKIYAKKYNLKYFLSGANFALESILQRGNAHFAADSVHIKDIHKKFGEVPITNLPLISLFDRYFAQKYIHGIKTLKPLDFIDYNREKAINELREHADFDYYGGKHYESVFTKFVQVYYLPKKFGVDKRTSHLSSLIISGQITREQALEELKKPLFEHEKMEKEIDFILSEIGLSRKEFEKIMNNKGKQHSEYKVSSFVYLQNIARRFRRLLGE